MDVPSGSGEEKLRVHPDLLRFGRWKTLIVISSEQFFSSISMFVLSKQSEMLFYN